MSTNPDQSQPVRWFGSVTLWTILAIGLVAWLLWDWLGTNHPTSFRETFGRAAIPVSLTIHIVLAMTPFPSDIVAMANGVVYGVGLGTVLSCIGWWVAALLQFGLGRRARSDFNLESQASSLPAWMQRIPVNHPFYLIGVRQIPLLGMHVGSFVPGAAGVPLRRFAWCSAIGVFPGSLIMTALGAGIAQQLLPMLFH